MHWCCILVFPEVFFFKLSRSGTTDLKYWRYLGFYNWGKRPLNEFQNCVLTFEACCGDTCDPLLAGRFDVLSMRLTSIRSHHFSKEKGSWYPVGPCHRAFLPPKCFRLQMGVLRKTTYARVLNHSIVGVNRKR